MGSRIVQHNKIYFLRHLYGLKKLVVITSDKPFSDQPPLYANPIMFHINAFIDDRKQSQLKLTAVLVYYTFNSSSKNAVFFSRTSGIF